MDAWERLAERLASMPADEREQYVAGMDPQEREALRLWFIHEDEQLYAEARRQEEE